MDSFYGTVRKVVHRAGSFHILSVDSEGTRGYGRPVSVTGHVFGVQQVVEGTPFQLFGDWTNHPKYGRQFSLSGWRPHASDKIGLRVFLRSCLGISSEEVIEEIVQAYGLGTFEVFSTQPERLLDLLTKMGCEGYYEEILTKWGVAQTSAELSEFFADHDVTAQQMQGIFETFGVDAKEIIAKNPYELVQVDSFSFGKVDQVADRLNVRRSDPRRFEGAVFWILREAARNGHLCVRRGDLASQLIDLSQASEVQSFANGGSLAAELSAAVTRLAERKAVFVDPEVGVYLPSYHKFERDSASLLADFTTPMKLDVELGEFVSTYETVNGITLSDAQRDAVEKLVHNKVLVLTGLPGTGKTTVIRSFVHLFQRAGLSYRLMAPTGIASKRLAAVTSSDAYTIHRTFGYDGKEWRHNRENKYPVGAIIVDEMSMVDQELFFRIMDALDPSTVLVFVGDDAQLPSVGPGSVLRELVGCASVPTVRLTQIFRQKETSDIVLNSHRINRGEALQNTKGSESEFRFVQMDDESKILDLIVQMAVKLKAKDANFQILSPKYDGLVGVNSLNERLREALNPPEPGKPEFSAATLRVRHGDRLMVIKNDYERSIYNGDMCKLIGISSEALTVKIHGAGEDGMDLHVDIPRRDALQKLRLAYAITVHKAQGSEFDTVILPIVKAHGRMLQRNLFYTAVTRAKKKVWLLGEAGAVSKAIANDKVVQRNTGFGRAITQAMGSRVAVGVAGAHVERDVKAGEVLGILDEHESK